MPGGAAAWLILTQQQRGGSAHVCFSYDAATEVTYGGTAGWTYAGTLSPSVTYAGEC